MTLRVLYHYAAGPALARRLAALTEVGIEVLTCSEQDDERFFELLPTTEVLWHCLRPIDAEVLDAAPVLRLIQKIGIGVNTIDLGAARARGIAVCNLPGSNSRAVAEHTLGLMLAVLRRIVTFDRLLHAGRGWDRPSELEDDLGEIAGRTVGLIGYGAVPRLLAPILAALGAKVCYATRQAKPAAIGQRLSLEALLERADIVSLHLPLLAQTRHLLNAERLQRMRRGAILVNTARGGLVDTAALIDCLQRGHLAGAGIDVFEAEPVAPNDPLLSLPNVVLTPHVAWLTQETLERSVVAAVENCQRLASGQPLLHEVV